MARSLLEYTQEILSDMTSDEVNSITDTAEAEAVARIVIKTYEAMMSNRNWPHQKQLIKLETYSDTAKPTHLKVPDEVKELISINYNAQKLGSDRRYYQEIKWKDNDAFLRMMNNRNNLNDNIQIVNDASGIELLIQNDKHPEYFTSFDDEIIIFDSFDKEVDDTIHSVNLQCLAYVKPTTLFDDEWIPDLPSEAEIAFLEEATSKAQFKINEVQDIKSEQEAGRQNRWLARKAWKTKGGLRYPNYGRKGNKGRKDPTFRQDY